MIAICTFTSIVNRKFFIGNVCIHVHMYFMTISYIDVYSYIKISKEALTKLILLLLNIQAIKPVS